MAELGLVGACLPMAHGGSGLGYVELGLIAEACGRSLAATPLISTVALGASVLLASGQASLCERLLPKIIAGDRIVALAHDEGSRFAPHRVATRAVADAGGYRIDGAKSFVLDGHLADQLVVVARTSGAETERDGLTLFMLERDAAGLEVQRLHAVDHRNVSALRLTDVHVADGAVLGQPGRGADLLDPALMRATAVLCAEMLGGVCEVFDRTLQYLKERKQFGAPIGSFQALQHRAARLFCEIQLSKTIVAEAMEAIDGGRDDAELLVSTAKTRLSDVYMLVANEAIQMHGGIGVTDECDIGLFLKRARVAAMTFGTAAYHRDRFAALRGF